MKKIFLLLLLLMIAFAPAYANVGVKRNGFNIGTATDIDIGNAGFLDGSTLTLGFTSIQGTSTMVSGSVTVPTTYRIIHKAIGSAIGGTLANGTAGQVITIDVLSNSGGFNYTVTPATCTGFTTFTLSAVGSSITLAYLDDTYGWVLVYRSGATIQ